jgi:hypothetical protein
MAGRIPGMSGPQSIDLHGLLQGQLYFFTFTDLPAYWHNTTGSQDYYL